MELRRRRYCIFPTLSPPNQGAAYIFLTASVELVGIFAATTGQSLRLQ